MYSYFLTDPKKSQYKIILGDISTIIIAIFCSYILRWAMDGHLITYDLIVSKIGFVVVVIASLHVLSLYILDMYNPNKIVFTQGSAINVIVSVVVSAFIIGFILFFFPKYIFGRKVFVFHLILTTVGLLFWRYIFSIVHHKTSRQKQYLVVGYNQNVERFTEEIRGIYGAPKTFERIYLNKPNKDICSFSQLPEFDSMLYDINYPYYKQQDVSQIIGSKFSEKEVFDFPTYYQRLTGRTPLEHVNSSWLLSRSGGQGKVYKPYEKIKRSLDVFLSFVLLVALAPLGLILAILIKLESEGPVFFSQERLGKNRVNFKCYKFRSMVDNAESLSGPVWAADSDKRITKVGKLLRKTRLDEIPQLINILFGDMSFIGPRPIRQHFAEQLEKIIPYYDLRFCVQPGLSGWAQVSYDYAGSEEGQRNKFEYELFYVLNKSFVLDMIIVLKTLKTVFRAKGQ